MVTVSAALSGHECGFGPAIGRLILQPWADQAGTGHTRAMAAKPRHNGYKLNAQPLAMYSPYQDSLSNTVRCFGATSC
jgi:hypothetical protein